MDTYQTITAVCMVITVVCVVITAVITLPKVIAERKLLSKQLHEHGLPQDTTSQNVLEDLFDAVTWALEEIGKFVTEYHFLISSVLIILACWIVFMFLAFDFFERRVLVLVILLNTLSVMVGAVGFAPDPPKK